MNKSLSQLVTLVILSLFVTACGKNSQIVTGVQVQSSVVAQDINVAFKADLDLGNISFPAVTLPILHPKGLGQIGAVDLLPLLGGKNQIMVKLNLSKVTDLQAVSAVLPNGNLIPLIANNPTIVVPLGAGAQLYITVSATVTAIGVAVPIKTFDSIGGSVGGLSLFPVFNIDKVVGSAGIFTSKNAGQNGFAIIADLSQYVKMQDIFVPQSAAPAIASASMAKSLSLASISALEAAPAIQDDSIKLDMSEQRPSSAKEKRINSMLYDMHLAKKRLQLRR
jgi:hypothetical protein